MTVNQDAAGSEWKAGVYDGNKVMTRPLEATEMIFASGEEKWPVKFTISLNLQDSKFDQALFTQRIRLAWLWLALEHPQTTTTALEGNFVTQLLDSSEEQELWLQKTFIVVEGTNAEEYDVFSNLPNYALLYYFPASSQVTLVCPHVNIDAAGALKAFDLLMNRAVNHEAVDKDSQGRVENLPPSLEHALGLHIATEKEQALVEQALGGLQMAQPSLADESQPASEQEIKEKGCLAHQVLKFTAEETSTIISKSKQAGISVTSFVFAALLGYLTELETNKECSNFISFDPYSMRSLLPDVQANTPFAFYGGLWPSIIETASNDPKTALKNVDSHFKNISSQLRGNERPLIQALKPMSMRCQQVFQSLAQQPEIRPTPSISSFGVCDKLLNPSYGSIQVSDFYVTTKSSSPQCPCFAFTFRNRLNFVTTYNRQFHSDAQIAERNQRIKDKMLQLLELDL
ncbi:hypothetical protein TRICI_003915 [Trichomonascus ciferrii]|uniref:Condensation domain-containing protein n=1 Tax=Trichomonascus ciferrii TaxID=44093 RepID=A0A642V220_9ASCO|nr:hypothetical protein TRICI_003915 [Trichomonascus ciferrii]